MGKAIRHSPFAIRHSPFAIRHSPFAIRHSPFAIRHSPFYHGSNSIFCFQKGLFYSVFPSIRMAFLMPDSENENHRSFNYIENIEREF